MSNQDIQKSIGRAALSATQPAQAAQSTHWTELEPVRLASSRAGRVYIAGPMTGIEEFNFPAFNAEAARLRGDGLAVLNPAEHGIVDGAEWADYLRHDIAGLASCERIHLLRGWSKSKGACLEMTIAKALGMTVTYQVDAEIEHNNAPAVPQNTDHFEDDLYMVAPFGYFRPEPFGWTDCAKDDEGAIALYEHPAAPAQEPVQAGELPAFEQWWRQRQLLTFPKDYDQSRLADWGAAYKPAAKDAWQARAALAARKPLTKPQISCLAQEEELLLICDGLDSLEDLVSVIERAHGIGLEVKP